MVESFGPHGPNWLSAIGLGLLVAVLGGFAFGIVIAVTGYVVWIVAIGIGSAVAFAMRREAGTVTTGLLLLGIPLAWLGVFVGHLIGITFLLIRMGFEVSPFDVFMAYPTIVSIERWGTIGSYLFALLGTLAAGRYLRRETRDVIGPSAARWRSVNEPFQTPFSIRPPSSGGPTVEVLDSTPTKTTIRVILPGASTHVIDASYETTRGGARVSVDGRLRAQGHVGGRQKIYEMSAPGDPSRKLRFRFYGQIPKIEVSLDGVFLNPS